MLSTPVVHEVTLMATIWTMYEVLIQYKLNRSEQYDVEIY